MKILIAEDDLTSRMLLEATFKKKGFEVITTENGTEAWATMEKPDPPRLMILDWMMPEMDGLEICQKIRTSKKLKSSYIILLTAKVTRDDLIRGLDAGADDYIIKPFNKEELLARLKVGLRIIDLQTALADQVRKLQEALDQINTLRGIIPICSYCKKIRDDKNYWQQVEGFISRHSLAEFSHGVCPECYEKHVQPQLDEIQIQVNKKSTD